MKLSSVNRLRYGRGAEGSIFVEIPVYSHRPPHMGLCSQGTCEQL